MAGWEGCDGKIFKPYKISEKVNTLSDFVGAAMQQAKDKERELEMNEEQKKKQQERVMKKKGVDVKKAEADIDSDQDDNAKAAVEDDDGFTTIDDAKNRPKQQQKHQYNKTW